MVHSHEPIFETYEGDADVYALSANVNRRMLTKGQRAMLVVMATQRGFAVTAKSLSQESDLRLRMIEQARTLARYAPDLVPDVIAGARTLDPAYNEARDRKRERDLRAAKIADLKGDYPWVT